MNVTGVGSSYNFIYNAKTNKASTKDGSKNEFVDFFNGEVKGEDTETLNHFDAHTRYQFERMLYVYGTGMTGQNPFANNEEVEITADIESATKTSFYVNGQKSFTAYTGMSYLPSEIKIFGTIEQPFRTTESKPYDPKTNSITIGVGSKFDLGNGYSMTVMEDCIWGEGYGNGSLADDERTNMMVGGLGSLLHFADQQWFSSTTDIYTDHILEFLSSQGVDTSREFVINGTHCELVHGKIREVGNDYVVPSSIQQVAVKRYEDGGSVASALQAARQMLYDLENPLMPDNQHSEDVIKYRELEKEFYRVFIEKLEGTTIIKMRNKTDIINSKCYG